MMKVGHHWTSGLFVISALCLTLSADNVTECETEIKVKRNTVYVGNVGEQLRIACPVSWCENLTPTIHWIKFETTFTDLNISRHLTTEWSRINNNEGVHFLIFNNVLSSDSGRYQCKHGSHVMSHTIRVTVRDITENGTSRDLATTKTPSFNEDDDTQWWLYVCVAVGIVGFVVIVIVISVLVMRGCKGGSKNNDQSQNQYVDIPMVEQPVHRAGHQASPRPSPCVTPSHRTSRRKKSPPAPAQRENVYDQIEGHMNLPEEQGSGVVYAALNHEPRAGASPRVRTTVEERSEYAAIRVV